MKHLIGPVKSESAEQAAARAEFEAWMKDNYVGFHLDVHPNSGCYTESAVNCAWDVWLHKTP